MSLRDNENTLKQVNSYKNEIARSNDMSDGPSTSQQQTHHPLMRSKQRSVIEKQVMIFIISFLFKSLVQITKIKLLESFFN